MKNIGQLILSFLCEVSNKVRGNLLVVFLLNLVGCSVYAMPISASAIELDDEVSYHVSNGIAIAGVDVREWLNIDHATKSIQNINRADRSLVVIMPLAIDVLDTS